MNNMDDRLLGAAMSGNVSELKDMVQQNPEILLGTTQQGSTSLHISSMFGHVEFSETVVSQNQSLLSHINSYGETPLLAAVTSYRVSLASTLLKLYQQLNLSEMILKQDDNGDNVLHHSIRNGHSDLALELIDAEPRLSQGLNKYNESPMYIAVSRGFGDVLDRILAIPESSHLGPCDENALHAAVRLGNPGISKKILKARPSIARDANNLGNTPMALSVLWERLEIVQVLLKQDRSLGYLVNKKTGTPLLVAAAFQGNVAIAKEIANYCPDAPYSTPDAGTMLHQAVQQGHEEFVEFITKTPQFHKLINMREPSGKTALHIAVLNCNPKIVRALLAHKAIDLTVVSNNGNTPGSTLACTTELAKTLNWVC